MDSLNTSLLEDENPYREISNIENVPVAPYQVQPDQEVLPFQDPGYMTNLYGQYAIPVTNQQPTISDQKDDDINKDTTTNDINNININNNNNNNYNTISNSGNTYELYNINYQKIEVSQWQMGIDAPTPNSNNFWGNESTFEPLVFVDKINTLKKIGNPLFYAFFWINFCITFIVGIIVLSDAKPHFAMNNAFGYTVLVSFIFISVNMVLMLFLPVLWLKFGILVSLGISFVLMIVSCVFHLPLSILYFILLLVPTIMVFYFSHHSIEFSNTALKYIIRSQFNEYLYNYIFLGGIICFMIVFSLFFGYVFCCANVLLYNKFFFVYLVFSFWFIINTFCNVIYMASSFCSITNYVTLNTMRTVNHPILQGLKKAILYHIGTAAKMALILPFIEWIKICATLVLDIIPIYPFANQLYRFVRNNISPKMKIWAQKLDNKLSYLSRLGMVYTATFGVPVEEGCLRNAENTSKYYVNILNEICTIGNNLASHCLIVTITGCFTVHAICLNFVSKGDLSIQAIASAITAAWSGFFMTFAIVQGWRALLRGTLDGIFVGFAEHPSRMRVLSEETSLSFENEFRNEINRRKSSIVVI